MSSPGRESGSNYLVVIFSD